MDRETGVLSSISCHIEWELCIKDVGNLHPGLNLYFLMAQVTAWYGLQKFKKTAKSLLTAKINMQYKFMQFHLQFGSKYDCLYHVHIIKHSTIRFQLSLRLESDPSPCDKKSFPEHHTLFFKRQG